MPKNTTQLRRLWKDFECEEGAMVLIPFGPDRIRVAPPTTQAFEALAAVLHHHGYKVRTQDTDSYNCRTITGGTGKSLHSYGIALDVNWETNPYRNHAGQPAGALLQQGHAGTPRARCALRRRRHRHDEGDDRRRAQDPHARWHHGVRMGRQLERPQGLHALRDGCLAGGTCGGSGSGLHRGSRRIPGEPGTARFRTTADRGADAARVRRPPRSDRAQRPAPAQRTIGDQRRHPRRSTGHAARRHGTTRRLGAGRLPRRWPRRWLHEPGVPAARRRVVARRWGRERGVESCRAGRHHRRRHTATSSRGCSPTRARRTS